MRWTTIGLGIVLLIGLSSTSCSINHHNPESVLPPLQEDLVEVYWLSEGEIAPFEGLLMNKYSYERIMLKLWEADNIR